MIAENTAVGQEPVPFLNITETLWTPSSSSSKLSGILTWPFKLALPEETSLAEKEKELLKEEAEAGMVETTKKDIRDAAAHGVLAPPPEGASWAGRLFHQAKELFVSLQFASLYSRN